MNDNFVSSEDDLLIADYSEDAMEQEVDRDVVFIDSEEEEKARYAEIIRELTEFEKSHSESTIDK